MIKNNIKFRQVHNIFDCNGKVEACVVEVFVEDKLFYLVSCYRAPQSPIISVQEWITFLTQFGDNAIFGGDLNAHSVEWGSNHTCPWGNNLSVALSETDFSCLNDGTPTRLNGPNGVDSIIDLTITHASWAIHFQYTILPDP